MNLLRLFADNKPPVRHHQGVFALIVVGHVLELDFRNAGGLWFVQRTLGIVVAMPWRPALVANDLAIPEHKIKVKKNSITFVISSSQTCRLQDPTETLIQIED